MLGKATTKLKPIRRKMENICQPAENKVQL